jgi:hypothetical protein
LGVSEGTKYPLCRVLFSNFANEINALKQFCNDFWGCPGFVVNLENAIQYFGGICPFFEIDFVSAFLCFDGEQLKIYFPML